MAHREQKKPAILILTGASGAGKTALILALQGLNLPDLAAINCDRDAACATVTSRMLKDLRVEEPGHFAATPRGGRRNFFLATGQDE